MSYSWLYDWVLGALCPSTCQCGRLKAGRAHLPAHPKPIWKAKIRESTSTYPSTCWFGKLKTGWAYFPGLCFADVESLNRKSAPPCPSKWICRKLKAGQPHPLWAYVEGLKAGRANFPALPCADVEILTQGELNAVSGSLCREQCRHHNIENNIIRAACRGSR